MAIPQLDKILEKLNATTEAQTFADQGEQILLFAEEQLEQARRSREDVNIAVLVEKLYSEARSARAVYERQWYKNLDMYLGRQFSDWDVSRSMMVERAKPDYENRLCINIIEPIIRTETAKTSSVHPRATVVPASNDDVDVRAARAAEAIWDWYYDTSNYHRGVYSVANFWRGITGVGYVKMFYDESAIDPQATEVRKKKVREQNRRLQASGLAATDEGSVEPVRGLITATPVSPFHLSVGDLTDTTIENQPWLIHSFTVPVERAKMVYGKYAEKAGKTWEPNTVSANELVNLMHLNIRTSGDGVTSHVLVHELYIKEGVHELFPKGGMAVVAGGTLVGVARDGMIYDHGEHPFGMLTGVETGGFYRKSVIESITPIQDDLNQFYNDLVRTRQLLGKPMFYYDEGSFDPRRVRSRPGVHIPIKLGMRDPRPLQMAEPPQFAFNLVDRLMIHRDDISGQHQVSRATSPGADTAASALALLKETDDDYLSTTFDSIQDLTRRMGSQYLSLAVQFWDEPRMVKVAGVEHALNVTAFRGADIAGGTDVRVDGESVLPKSKAAKIAQVTEWIDKGILPPEVGLDVLEMGNLGKVYDRIRRDRDAAANEHTMLMSLTPEMILEKQQEHQRQVEEMMAQVEQATGATPDPALAPPAPPIIPINWYDNHEVHYEEHRLFANSPSYGLLSPEQQKVLEEHATLHLAEIQATMMAADPNQQPMPEDAAAPAAGA